MMAYPENHWPWVVGTIVRYGLPLLCYATALLVLLRRPCGWAALMGIGAMLITIPVIAHLFWGPSFRFSYLPFPEQMTELLLISGTDYGRMLFSIGLLGVLWEHLPRRQGRASAR